MITLHYLHNGYKDQKMKILIIKEQIVLETLSDHIQEIEELKNLLLERNLISRLYINYAKPTII